MYIGNLSNFFYKDKSWLSKQPKISIDSNKINNILKIKKHYFTFDTLTGKLKLINSNKISQQTLKENNDIFPEIKNNIQSNRNKNSSYNNSINTETNYGNNSSINKFISLYYNKIDDKNKSNDNINNTNIFSKSIKSENNLLNNSFSNSKGQDNNTKVLKKNDNSNIFQNKKIDSSFKIKIKNKKNLSISVVNRNDIKQSQLKFEKYKKNEEKKNFENKFLSKRNLKKFIEKRQKSIDEIKTNITSTNNSNNNISTSLTNKNNNSHYNNRYNPNIIYKNKKYNNNKYDLLKEIFPNYKSLKINDDDSWYLKSIKNQLFKDKIYYDLEKKYQFYEDLNNKRNIFKIPKLNVKKTIILNKHEIFPAKEPLHHKIYFDYVNKQRTKDNHSYKVKYHLLVN